MFPPKKKPGVDVMIAVGKPKQGGPPPLDTPGMKKPMPASDPEEGSMHEASESPDMESSEDYGAKLTADIDSVFEEIGIDKTEGRHIASKLFSAVAKCLMGGGDSASMGGDSGEYGA